MLYTISKEFKADIAHFVPTQKLKDPFECKCQRLHGHTITIKPILIGNLNKETRMVLDYTYLTYFKRVIDTHIDHRFIIARPIYDDYQKNPDKYPFVINEDDKTLIYFVHRSLITTKGYTSILEIQSTTAEDMVRFLVVVLLGSLAKIGDPTILSNIQYVNIEFKETPNSSASLYDPIEIPKQVWSQLVYIMNNPNALLDKWVYDWLENLLQGD